jgi:hypothetical protein
MSTLIIHGGTHKTATTLIQETLHQNRNRLAPRGFVYPTIGSATGHHLLAAEWLPHLASYRDARLPSEHWRELIARYAKGSKTVILSSEEFSRFAPDQIDMQALAAFTSAFESRRIVFVLRNQLAYIQSLYLEMQRQYRLPGVDTYVKQCLSNGHASGMFLDYAALYDHALTAFSVDEVQLLSYEALAASGPDITHELLRALNLPLDDLELEAPPNGRGNISPPPLAAWAANRVSSPAIAGVPLVDLAARAFTQEFGKGIGSTLFTPEEAEAIRRRFEPMNRTLEARYRAVDPTFLIAPVQQNPNAIHRGQILSSFWLRIARLLHEAQRL